MIRKIYKKDVPELINDVWFWSNQVEAISKHRLTAHYNNPNLDDDDIVLLLAINDDEVVGYMGVFIDIIHHNQNAQKIGWLSTWWVHPKTKGQGIGRLIFNTMYEELNGKIGVSQFTPSAKRIYDKSGYFMSLKNNDGYKFVLRSNLGIVLPLVNAKYKKVGRLLNTLDRTINAFVNVKVTFQQKSVQGSLKNIRLKYVNSIDKKLEDFINDHSEHHLSRKTPSFFNWLKSNKWVESAPVKGLVNCENYQFSMYAKHFDFYYVEIYENNRLVGFVILQKRDGVLKVLFSYYLPSVSKKVAKIVLLHACKLNIQEIICYDQGINDGLKGSLLFLYKRKKVKASIISKSFEIVSFDDYELNFGDGDCCFA